MVKADRIAAAPLALSQVRLLGVDAGTLKVGLALYIQADEVIWSHQLRLPGATFGARMCYLEDFMMAAIRDQSVTHLAVEKAVMHQDHPAGGSRVGQGVCVVHMVGHRAGFADVCEVNNASAKHMLAGSIHASKRDVMAQAALRWGKKMGEDESDAGAVCLTAFSYLKMGTWPHGPQRAARQGPRRSAETTVSAWWPAPEVSARRRTAPRARR